MSASVVDEILSIVSGLDSDAQLRVLRLVSSLKDTSAKQNRTREILLKQAGSMSKEDAEEMWRVIERDCRRIEPDEW